MFSLIWKDRETVWGNAKLNKKKKVNGGKAKEIKGGGLQLSKHQKERKDNEMRDVFGR